MCRNAHGESVQVVSNQRNRHTRKMYRDVGVSFDLSFSVHLISTVGKLNFRNMHRDSQITLWIKLSFDRDIVWTVRIIFVFTNICITNIIEIIMHLTQFLNLLHYVV